MGSSWTPAPGEVRAAGRDEVRRLIAAPVVPASAAWDVGRSAAAFTVRT
ncbi:hypothetical protein [Streptomyces sp. NPDC048521]